MDPRTITKEELATLLREAEQAHAEYEKMLGGRDEDWPSWYAEFILKKVLKTNKLSTNPLPTYEPTNKAVNQVEAVKAPPAPEAAKENDVDKKAEAPKAEAPKSDVSKTASISMQVCPSCGHSNRAGILFCENCGTNLSTGQQAIIGTRDLRDAEEAEDAAKPDGKSEEAASPVIKLDTSESKAIRSAGTSRFESNMTLRIEIEGGANPIILKPKTHDMILGRRDPTTGATPEVDLTPYAGYRMGVSRKHASLRLEDNQLNIWDLGSSNGTFINGMRLNPHRPYPIRDGDEIRLGQMVLRMFFQIGQTVK
jgi:predicted component of type VI protein secretion system